MEVNNDLRPQERESFKIAQALLAPLGILLVVAVEEYVKCRSRLGEVPLQTSVEDYLRRTSGFTAGHYRELVMREEADKWFAILPEPCATTP